MNIYEQYSIMSGVFLTDRIPVELFIKSDESNSYDEIDDFIRDHVIEALENTNVADVWELIEDATNIGRGFSGWKRLQLPNKA